MVPLDTVLLGFVLIFGLMGALRGWSREMLVLFSIVVALAMRLIFTQYVPIIRDLLNLPLMQRFYVDIGILVLMAVAGYAGPVVSGRLAGMAAREKIQDILLGFIIGALNGYLIIGSVWYFVHTAGYGVWGIIPPDAGSLAASLAASYLPPLWLSGPILLTVFVLASVFVVIVIV